MKLAAALSSVKLAVAGSDPKTAIKTLSTNIKTTVTILGGVLVLLNEVLPWAPADQQHWMTGVISIGTLLTRDLTDVAQKLDEQ